MLYLLVHGIVTSTKYVQVIKYQTNRTRNSYNSVKMAYQLLEITVFPFMCTLHAYVVQTIWTKIGKASLNWANQMSTAITIVTGLPEVL